MSQDPTGFTPASIMAQAALDAKRQKEEKERATREKLLNQSRAVRFITQEGILFEIRKRAVEFRDEALKKMEEYDDDSSEDGAKLLMREYKIHKMYVKLFDEIETQGRDAGKQLKAQEG